MINGLSTYMYYRNFDSIMQAFVFKRFKISKIKLYSMLFFKLRNFLN